MEGGRGLTDDGEHGKVSRGIKGAVDGTKARAINFAHNAEWAFGRRTARVLGVLALFATVVLLLLAVLTWYVGPIKPSEKKDLVLALAQILGGTALLSGLYFTWRTLQVNREGQITDRFTRAIDQLGKVDDKGNKLFEIRIGGIYALERIARESEEDHWAIMEVLTAYVRQHAPRQPEERESSEAASAGEKKSGEAASSEAASAGEKKSGEDSSGAPETTEGSTRDPDIQAIVTVLRRRTRSFGHGEPGPLDLHSTNLTGAYLTKAILPRAFLPDTNLSRASLRGADLPKAFLLWANLTEAHLEGANLEGAQLRRANLSGAQLRAILVRANLWETNLEGANLEGADLRRAGLSGANLTAANLKRADLRGAVLESINFDPDSPFFPFDEVDEVSVVLDGANLQGADLRGANLESAMISETQLVGTTGDKQTRLPSGLKPPVHWGEKAQEQIEED